MGSKERQSHLEEMATILREEWDIPFVRMPEGIYPGMPHTTPKSLAECGATRYTWQHIHSLIRQGKIPAYRIGGSVTLDAEGVRCVLERERAGLGGRRPGQKTQREQTLNS